jgi:hypothetical protein
MTNLINIAIACLAAGVVWYIHTRIDADWYGGIYEDIMQKLGRFTVHRFWQWIFEEGDITIAGTLYKNAVVNYRVLHSSIAFVMMSLLWWFWYSNFPWYVQAVEGFSWLSLFYFMVFEISYYWHRKNRQEIKKMSEWRINPYWLVRWWFSGRWMFAKEVPPNEVEAVYVFNEQDFNASAYIGITLWLVCKLIYLV